MKRTRILWIVAPVAVLTLVLAAVDPARANLSGSTFEGNDGNLVVTTAGQTDWSNAPARTTGTETASGKDDNSFGQGTKEDDPNVTIVHGSIPPQKSDLTVFYTASEYANSANYLYLAWERSNVLGSANMDFELNQNTTTGFTSSALGKITLNRAAGDILVTFDFGGGTPVLGLLKWVTSGSTAQCFSANALPCWGNRVNLSAAGFAEGAVNSGTITDPISGDSLAGGTFGEAAINLTAANVFPAGDCESFGAASLRSRSSASFTAEVKDFIAPQPVNVSNCGSVVINKVTQNGNGTFGFTSTTTTTSTAIPSSFDITTTALSGSRTFTNVLTGSYTVTEGAPPTDWTFVSVVCSAGTVDNTTRTGSFDVAPGATVTCTFTNRTKVQPTGSTAQNLIPNDTFTLTPSGGVSATGTVNFKLFGPADPTCAGTPAYATNPPPSVINPDPTLVANVASTSNTSFVASTPGTWRWLVVYSGDANNFGVTSACGTESFTIANHI